MPTDSTTQPVRNVIVVGSGPAGYTAAVYAARAQLEPLVFEGTQFGGALMTTTDVENYPGFRDGIMGPDLMEQMRTQAERFGAELRAEDVEQIELDRPGQVRDRERRAATARRRSSWRWARPRGTCTCRASRSCSGHGVSACATCDGFFFRDQDIAVVGGGDSAMEEATFLTKFARSVTIIHRRQEFRASRIMLERARANEKIRWQLDSEVLEVLGEGSVTGVRLRNTVTGEESTLDVTGVFMAIGHDPRSDARRRPARPGRGRLRPDPARTRPTPTSTACSPAGDLVDRTYRQAITAAGSGCSAAIDAERWLAEHAEASEAQVAAELVGGGYAPARTN